MKRGLAKAVLEATQRTIQDWFKGIDTLITDKGQDLLAYEEKKQTVIKKFLEADSKGISVRQLSKLTGISHQAISKWIKDAKAKTQNAQAS
jgi:DNA invertase Pin-like site-specific DNA recombinase